MLAVSFAVVQGIMRYLVNPQAVSLSGRRRSLAEARRGKWRCAGRNLPGAIVVGSLLSLGSAIDLPVQADESPAGATTANPPAAPQTGDPPAAEAPANPPAAAKQAANPEAEQEKEWHSLFDGKSLDGWESSKFGGGGDVYVEDGHLVIDFGASLNGIRYPQSIPAAEYELQLEAQRVDGNDFFCGLTFPVGKEYCSLILGGWGGAVVGLSSVDDVDAARNSTTQYIGFKSGTWYRVSVTVTNEHIRVRLDDKLIIDQPRAGHKFGVRIEVEKSQPLGLATFETRARYRNLRWRSLGAQDVAPAK